MKRVLAAGILSVLLLSAREASSGESSPAVRIAVAPKYPSPTLAGRVYGDVAVSITINRAGTVEVADVVSGHPMLREAALVAARQWQFAKGSLSKRKTTLTFRFILLPEDSEVKSQTFFLPPAGFEIRERPEPASMMEDEQGEPFPSADPVSVT